MYKEKNVFGNDTYGPYDMGLSFGLGWMQNFRKVFENENGQAVTADVKNQIKIVTLTQLSCIHSNFEYQVSSRENTAT